MLNKAHVFGATAIQGRERWRRAYCAIFLLLTVLMVSTTITASSFFAAVVWAENQSEKALEQADQLSSSLMSPFCPGRLLRDCPSSKAADLKEQIYKRLAAGETSADVLQSLIATYGEEMRASPRFQDFGALAWIAPAAFLLLVGAGIFYWLQKRTRLAEQDLTPITPELQRLLNAELKQEGLASGVKADAENLSASPK